MAFDPAAFKRELDALAPLLEMAEEGHWIPVPDGTLDAIKEIRKASSRAFGPQEAGDLVPLFKSLARDMEATRRHAFMTRLGQKLTR
jgi:hypothetical protein